MAAQRRFGHLGSHPGGVEVLHTPLHSLFDEPLGGDDMGGGVGPLGGSGHPEQGDGLGIPEDPIDGLVQLDRRKAKDSRGHGHDHVPLGEDLPLRQHPVLSENPFGQLAQALVGETLAGVLAPVRDAGLLDVGHQLLEWESGIGQLLLPDGQ